MQVEPRQKILAIVGPTAIGKSKVAQRLSVELAGELISADSMKVYKHMNIGTAKPTAEEQKLYAYHCINLVDPWQNFSVSQYQRASRKAIGEITTRNHLPILVGGTGLYLRAAFDKLFFPTGKIGTEIRDYLTKDLENGGSSFLFELLANLDPKAAARIHPNNYRRVIRALEVIYQTGKPFSEYYNEWQKYESIFDIEIIGLFLKRENLNTNILKRVETMIMKGWIEETKDLLALNIKKSTTAQQSIGYSQLIEYLERKKDLEDAILEIIAKTKQYAKRQMTWFNRDMRIKWIDVEEKSLDQIAENIYDYLDQVNFI